MPAIRKIRIVNFRFNDGAKLIPDEIFCTENSEGKPIDTLLNLDNGGGKSVIVQLLLQPVCPRARVQNRSISDYFQKGTDHAFVLIEWALDGSSNSLITGIALAASTTADGENESKTVRFYTFMHDYTRAGDKLDIINLPLSERSGSCIRTLSYDDVRKFLQRRNVRYYPSDSLRRYHKDLEEYGILHTEWENILVRINAVEGGIAKFFEEYKTADRLLDRFIIPGVMPNERGALEELEDMFLNYAESYASQEDNLRLQSRITAFTEKLQGTLPLIKDMWDAEDSRVQSIHLLADRLFTLDSEIKKEEERRSRLEETIAGLNEKLLHIEAEKASEAYYLAKGRFDEAQARLDECKRTKEDADIHFEQCTHKVRVLNAAKEYEELKELQNELTALYAQLRELDRGTQDSRILSLKYSLLQSCAKLIGSSERGLDQEMETRKSCVDTLLKIQDDISQLDKLLSKKNNELNQAIGRSDYLHEQIENGLKALGLHITVMLGGKYSADDIENINAGYDEQTTAVCGIIDNCLNEEKQLREELDGQDAKRSELAQLKAEYTVRLKQYEAALEQYEKAYDAAMPVLEHLSLPANRLFSDEPASCLDRILAQLKDQRKRSERTEETLAEQIRCIENGQLHLSKTAADVLQETGIDYQTGEKYLNYQSPKIREDILAINPLTAYSVIVNSEKDKQKLLSYSTDAWLPSVIPVYTLLELADMADGKWSENNRFLSAFDKEYFDDVSAYTEHIRQKLSDTKAEIRDLDHRIGEWKAEREILSGFTYSADYESRIKENISSCQAQLQNINNELSALDKRKREINKRISELRKLKNEQQERKNIIERSKEKFGIVCGIITEYEQLGIQISEARSECDDLSGQLEANRREENRLLEQIKECDDKVNQLQEKLTEYRNLLGELKDTPETELICEEYSALLAEYRLYCESYSADRRRLQDRLQKAQKDIAKKTKDVRRFHIEPSEYENTVYTDDAYIHAEQQEERAKREFEQMSVQFEKAGVDYAKAESLLEQAEKKLAELPTELLPRSEVGSEFERRIGECKTALNAAEKDRHECAKHLDKLGTDRDYTARYAQIFKAEIAEYTPKRSELDRDTYKLRDTIENCIETLRRAENLTKEYHRRELEPFRSTHELFTGTLDGILLVIDDRDIKGDKYYTLYERTQDDIKRYRDRIAQLAVLLKDVEDSRKQLVDHCFQRVGRLYENLNTLSNRSTVQIGNVKRQMIRIGLPEIDPLSEQPANRIDQYITEQVKKYLSEHEATSKSHRDHLEIRRLLNCYIGKESIPITVFKIDKSISNSRYRSWQDALKANSGGEQFVVLFSLVVSIMNYTRSLTNSLKHTGGVLILDNPFGPISSPHLLEPMFRIAHHFHIQLICLTHLGTAAVTSNFDMVYQLRFKSLPLSNVEILESEAKQHMEHAYYLSEQLSLF